MNQCLIAHFASVIHADVCVTTVPSLLHSSSWPSNPSPPNLVLELFRYKNLTHCYFSLLLLSFKVTAFCIIW